MNHENFPKLVICRLFKILMIYDWQSNCIGSKIRSFSHWSVDTTPKKWYNNKKSILHIYELNLHPRMKGLSFTPMKGWCHLSLLLVNNQKLTVTSYHNLINGYRWNSSVYRRFFPISFSAATCQCCATNGRDVYNCPTFKEPPILYSLAKCPWRFLGIISQDPSVYPTPTSYMLWSFSFPILLSGLFSRFLSNDR